MWLQGGKINVIKEKGDCQKEGWSSFGGLGKAGQVTAGSAPGAQMRT